MLASLGHDVSPVGVARLYADFLDVLVIDERDAALADRVGEAGPRPLIAQTIMSDLGAKTRLAEIAITAAEAPAGG